MADNSQLVVDEEYLKETAAYIFNSGYLTEKNITSYITMLQRINQSAIMKGEIAISLAAFLAQANKLKGIVSGISSDVKSLVGYFGEEIVAADNFKY